MQSKMLVGLSFSAFSVICFPKILLEEIVKLETRRQEVETVSFPQEPVKCPLGFSSPVPSALAEMLVVCL